MRVLWKIIFTIALLKKKKKSLKISPSIQHFGTNFLSLYIYIILPSICNDRVDNGSMGPYLRPLSPLCTATPSPINLFPPNLHSISRVIFGLVKKLHKLGLPHFSTHFISHSC